MPDQDHLKRVVSGIQPSGELHLGNYFGAIKRQVELQRTYDCFYFIADYHALTTLRDAKQLQAYRQSIAVDYLALGLDPERVTLYMQSDIPELTELTWLLLSVTGVGLLERGHSYKDKVAQGLPTNAALLTYPVLMTADILGSMGELVPVGKDQEQHIEIARDIALAFHAAYGKEVFALPEALYSETPRVPGTTFSREDRNDVGSPYKRDDAGKRIAAKMSKSYDNTIPVFAEGKQLKKLVGAIETDTRELHEPLDPDDDLVFALYRLFATEDEIEEMAEAYRRGGYGYGHAKNELTKKIDDYFAPFRDRRAELQKDPIYIDYVLAEGQAWAKEFIRETLEVARQAVGIRTR